MSNLTIMFYDEETHEHLGTATWSTDMLGESILTVLEENQILEYVMPELYAAAQEDQA